MSAPFAGQPVAADAVRQSEPMPLPPVDERATAPSVPSGLLRRYRAGASLSSLAKEIGVSVDWVAQRIIATGTRRDQVVARKTRRRPAELDSDQWLSHQLAGGAGVRDLSRRLQVTPSTVRNALRHYVARRADGVTGVGTRRSDPERRFVAASERAGRARVALERAQRLQASAVSEMRSSGLTIAAIADRLNTEEHLVETLLAGERPPVGP
jgi:lambda repressor-like predicted transcriptional regulator